jgi:3-methyl-2-oxobutanoate hydroxymethyltransferase
MPNAPNSRVTLGQVARKREEGEPIVMVTAYDFPSAEVAQEAGVDLVLAGDTGAEVALGYRSTVDVSVEEMLYLTSAVRRGLRTPLLIGDLPFGTYEASDEQAVTTAQRFVKEAGADVVKLERGGASTERARAIVQSGIPVMGHVGLTPQSQVALGGRRAQGRSASQALKVLQDALALQRAGCFAVVLEAVPSKVAALVTKRLRVPTIGIGAGGETDGQVLVWHDLLGMYDWRPPFAKAFAKLRPQMVSAVSSYARSVREARFPGPEHAYDMPTEELNEFERRLAEMDR